jgi:hypothetical protein
MIVLLLGWLVGAGFACAVLVRNRGSEPLQAEVMQWLGSPFERPPDDAMPDPPAGSRPTDRGD